MRPRVHTEKHIVQNSLFTIASGAISNVAPLNTLAVPAAAVDVREGSTVSAIYCEMWVITDDTASGTVITTLEKKPAGATNMTAAQSAALNDYPNKKNILYTQMGLISPNIQYPTNIIKGWIRIPKGKQSFSIGDSIRLNILAQSNGISACGFFVYKEQF